MISASCSCWARRSRSCSGHSGYSGTVSHRGWRPLEPALSGLVLCRRMGAARCGAALEHTNDGGDPILSEAQYGLVNPSTGRSSSVTRSRHGSCRSAACSRCGWREPGCICTCDARLSGASTVHPPSRAPSSTWPATRLLPTWGTRSSTTRWRGCPGPYGGSMQRFGGRTASPSQHWRWPCSGSRAMRRQPLCHLPGRRHHGLAGARGRRHTAARRLGRAALVAFGAACLAAPGLLRPSNAIRTPTAPPSRPRKASTVPQRDGARLRKPALPRAQPEDLLGPVGPGRAGRWASWAWRSPPWA